MTVTTRSFHYNGVEKSDSSQQPVYSEEFFLRPSWVNAKLALQQINKGKSSGSRTALWLRAHTQSYLFQTGCIVQNHAGKITFAAVLFLAILCIGLKHIDRQTDFQTLWVEEGGRLRREASYVTSSLGEGAGSLQQMIVQTSNQEDASILHADALLTHLKVIHAASQVTVDMDGVTWRLKDLCFTPSFPEFEDHLVEQILSLIIPCSFVTPLDCFWEGSKLLGPDAPVTLPGSQISEKISWTNLDPLSLLSRMNDQFSRSFNFPSMQRYMKRAGISNGYQSRPCLNPQDKECPPTAPNYGQKHAPDIGLYLAGGCSGFATKYMHWPEQLLVGGVEKNQSGHLLKARALQTVVPLMGEQDLYQHWGDTWKTHSMDWSMSKAKSILDQWQLRFTQEVGRSLTDSGGADFYRIHSFSMAALQEMMRQFVDVDIARVGIGYGLMLVYAFVSLLRWSDPLHSQGGLALAGVLLVSLSVGAGLGMCGLIGLKFNASSTQILPFLALGLGVDDMFIIGHTYAEANLSCIAFHERVGELLKRAGVSVLLTSICNIMAFLCAAILPIPAVRAFALQAAVVMLFNLVTILLIYPAMLGIDLRRRQARMYDLACCWSNGSYEADEKPVDAPETTQQNGASVESLDSVTSSRVLVTSKTQHHSPCPDSNACSQMKRNCRRFSISWFLNEYYLNWVTQRRWRVLVALGFFAVLIATVWGSLQVQDGLDLTDIVPRDSDQYQFFLAQNRYFGFFTMYAVTQGNFEYPKNQRLLYEYHDAFTRVPHVVKDDNGGLPDFWLGLFRDWLLDLQKAFDHDWGKGLINRERWHENATDEGILAYKLMVQTGHIDNPIDKARLPGVRLVDGGIINPGAFYNYLSAWVTNDALAYAYSQAQLRPEPKRWHRQPTDTALRIDKSLPLVFAQIPFYLSGLNTTETVIETINKIRHICERFEMRNLPNFPTGVPFTFWEQYLNIRFFLVLALVCIFTAVFLVVAVALMNVWAASVVVFVVGLVTLQLFATMGFLGLRLNAITATILIMSVGLGVEFTVHLMMGFLTSLGDRSARVVLGLQQMFQPVLHGAFSTLIGVVMLVFSEYDFIVRYFCYVLIALMVLGMLNGLVLLPVLLCVLGPPAEVRPAAGRSSLAAPSPEPSPPRARGPRVFRSSASRARSSAEKLSKPGSRQSLSTITEESGSSYSTEGRSTPGTPDAPQCAHDIVVEPRVVVQASYPSQEECRRSSGHFTTTVTATTSVKVEVHVPQTSLCRHSRTGTSGRHHRRK